MRKYFIFLLLFVFIFVASISGEEPTGKGNMVLSGGLNFYSASGDLHGSGSTYIGISPSALYFIKSRIAVGGSLTFSTTSYKDNGSITSWGIGPSVAYFFKNKNNQDVVGSFLPFVELSVLFKTNSSTNGYESSASGFNIPISGGFAYMVSQTASFFIKGYFSFDNMKSKNAEKGLSGTVFGITVGLKFFNYKK